MKEPAWLTHAIDQRLALIENTVGDSVPAVNLIMTPLREPAPGLSDLDFERWDRSCDNCTTFCPEGKAFYTGHIVRRLRNGVQVHMTFGVCGTCKTQLED